MRTPTFSVIVPVFNRPDDLEKLLQSLSQQTYPNFEVVVVEDGSSISSQHIFEKYANILTLHYLLKPNSGPGPSRNFGVEHSRGEYFVFFDSDCIVPPTYFQSVLDSISKHKWQAWGGPDRGHDTFTPLQQAMAYTMSARLTTGGIRGGEAKGFQPRSFNMGIHRDAWALCGGFRFHRYAEDIELSIRLRKSNIKVGLIADAFVYHRRRETLTDFFYQTQHFGMGRVQVGRAHPGEVKLTHWFPTFFLVGFCSIFFLGFVWPTGAKLAIALYGVYLLAVAYGGFVHSRNGQVAALSIPSAFVQMMGYGWGFLQEQLRGLK